MSEEYVPVLCPSCTNRQTLDRELSARTADVERLQADAERWQKLLVLLNDPVTYFYNDDGDRIEPAELTAAIDTIRAATHQQRNKL